MKPTTSLLSQVQIIVENKGRTYSESGPTMAEAFVKMQKKQGWNCPIDRNLIQVVGNRGIIFV